MNSPSHRSRQSGVTLIEVLVTVLILAFGILGIIGMNVKVQTSQAEAYQRAQAILLVQDMANRISVNRTDAASYVTASPLGSGTTLQTCAGTPGAALDQCEWGNLLRGAAEQSGGGGVGAMVNALGCVEKIGTNPSVYRVTVAWQGTSDLGTPSLSCGSGSYPRETLRRAISATVTLACLTAPTTSCPY